jgi:L-asparaginase II
MGGVDYGRAVGESWAVAPVLAAVVRGGLVESRHRGHVVGLDGAGREVVVAGSPHTPLFPRSSVKPLQAVGMLRAGLDVPDAQLAIVAGSHGGSAGHVAMVRAVLAGAGLTEADLRCPADVPLDPHAASEHARAGGRPAPILMNCSGKHAGMLATCVAAGWPTAGYTDPGHPLQLLIRATVEQLSGAPAAAVTVDGCGAPLFAFSLAGLARATRSLVTAGDGRPEHRVAAAMRAFPEMVGGAGRGDTVLMGEVPGLLAKTGAEGVAVAAAPDGRAAAVKIEDGSGRAVIPVLMAALVRLGALEPAALSRPPLDILATPVVLGGGRPVGHVAARIPHRGGSGAEPA